MSATNHTNILGTCLENATIYTIQAKGAVAASPLRMRLYSAAALAFAFHHLALRKGEWHLKAPMLLTTWLMSYPLLLVAELVIGAKSFGGSALNTILTLGCFTIVSFASIAVYRLFFHQLGAFPGPVMARATKLWHARKCLQGKNYLVLDELHQKYGEYVRTG